MTCFKGLYLKELYEKLVGKVSVKEIDEISIIDELVHRIIALEKKLEEK
jgi:hypothetical protein